jgi:hypothetical protein
MRPCYKDKHPKKLRLGVADYLNSGLYDEIRVSALLPDMLHSNKELFEADFLIGVDVSGEVRCITIKAGINLSIIKLI